MVITTVSSGYKALDELTDALIARAEIKAEAEGIPVAGV
jgi:hypothetical protein